MKILEKILLDHWQKKNPFLCLLLAPLAVLFNAITCIRRLLYRYGVLTQYSLPVPVIVVGNIQVGGSGKTPVVIYLARALQERGFRVGIISRGYGGTAKEPTLIEEDSQAAVCGDEPILLAQKSRLPVVVARKKVRAAQFLFQSTAPDVILSDDGLQHYALKRDLEIVVFPYVALSQNSSLLPNGPWREGLKRLQKAQFVLIAKIPLEKKLDKKVVANKLKISASKIFFLNTHVGPLYPFGHPETSVTAHDLPAGPVAAACAIGEPQDFFTTLQKIGIFPQVTLSYRDHTQLPLEKIRQRYPCVIITEKDAVKYTKLEIKGVYVLAIDVTPESTFLPQLIQKLDRLGSARK